MRIVAGTAGGIPLIAPPSPARPTMDRVREAVFSTLGERLSGARVLDLFAGSGSYALEALSRGAASASAVEQNRAALNVLKTNSQKARLAPTIVAADVFQYLKQAGKAEYDLIFADPPYAKRPGDQNLAAQLLACDALPELLANDGILILEAYAKWKLPPGNSWECLMERKYGDAGIWLLKKEAEVE